jgi:hypothetical protein
MHPRRPTRRSRAEEADLAALTGTSGPRMFAVVFGEVPGYRGTGPVSGASRHLDVRFQFSEAREILIDADHLLFQQPDVFCRGFRIGPPRLMTACATPMKATVLSLPALTSATSGGIVSLLSLTVSLRGRSWKSSEHSVPALMFFGGAGLRPDNLGLAPFPSCPHPRNWRLARTPQKTRWTGMILAVRCVHRN